jgi:hypothetical protein
MDPCDLFACHIDSDAASSGDEVSGVLLAGLFGDGDRLSHFRGREAECDRDHGG